MFFKDTINIIGSGCMVSLDAIYNEMKDIEKNQGEDHGILMIDSCANLLFRYHKKCDEILESNPTTAIGSTKQGMFPSSATKDRWGMQYGYFSGTWENFEAKYREFYDGCSEFCHIYKNPEVKQVAEDELVFLKENFDFFKRFLVCETNHLCMKIIERGMCMNCEQANSHYLSSRHGLRPFTAVTDPDPNAIATSLRVPQEFIRPIYSVVVKAISTRVGNGYPPSTLPFNVTAHPRWKELNILQQKYLQLLESFNHAVLTNGFEYGATSGRWRHGMMTDVVLLSEALLTSCYSKSQRSNSRQNELRMIETKKELDTEKIVKNVKENNVVLNLFKIDTLSGEGVELYNKVPSLFAKRPEMLKKYIPIVIGYTINGEEIKGCPNPREYKDAKPIVAYLQSWYQDVNKCRKWHELPVNARHFVMYFYKKVHERVPYISSGDIGVGPCVDDVVKSEGNLVNQLDAYWEENQEYLDKIITVRHCDILPDWIYPNF
jgi:adenylosuccinate synthase